MGVERCIWCIAILRNTGKNFCQGKTNKFGFTKPFITKHAPWLLMGSYVSQVDLSLLQDSFLDNRHPGR